MVIGESFRIYNFMITLIPAVLSKLYFHKAEGIWMNRIQKHLLQRRTEGKGFEVPVINRTACIGR
jgi:hypothetical protein